MNRFLGSEIIPLDLSQYEIRVWYGDSEPQDDPLTQNGLRLVFRLRYDDQAQARVILFGMPARREVTGTMIRECTRLALHWLSTWSGQHLSIC